MKTNSYHQSNDYFVQRKYLDISIGIVLYLIFFWLLKEGNKNLEFKISSMGFEASTLRGIITQFQMLISVYLVLKGKKAGYITAVLLNCYSIILSTLYLYINKSSISLPGIASYLGVIIICTFIINYQKKANDYVEKMEMQKYILEESEKKLYKMAFYDSLTKLPNKAYFKNILDESIKIAKKNNTRVVVMLIGLDAFKDINNTMGHSAGDFALRQITERLSLCLSTGDTISRFGGDEFLIHIPNIKNEYDVYEISSKIMDIFKRPIVVEDIDFFISASIGVVVYPEDGEDAESLVKSAGIAMYSAKREGKNRFAFCSQEIKNNIIKEVELTNSLYKALDKDELFLHYQPQIKIDTQEIIGFEALLRWNNSEYGVISPDIFIPIAEKTGLIKPIGLWIIKTVCEQCKNCRSILNKDFRISINVSIEQLKDKNIVDEIRNILVQTEANAQFMQIEITESIAFNDDPFILKRIQELKNLGITIAIDDFGKTYSSFSRLKTFPIDMIKIDMEFIRGIGSKTQKDEAIIKSIIQLSKNLGIQVLAEGVETEEQFTFLRNEDCDEVQGYYFYKPMAAEDIKALIAAIKL